MQQKMLFSTILTVVVEVVVLQYIVTNAAAMMTVKEVARGAMSKGEGRTIAGSEHERRS
jgi:hypothetical protein